PDARDPRVGPDTGARWKGQLIGAAALRSRPCRHGAGRLPACEMPREATCDIIDHPEGREGAWLPVPRQCGNAGGGARTPRLQTGARRAGRPRDSHRVDGEATRMSQLRITRLHPELGAEVAGVDLAGPIDGPTRAELTRALADHLALVFPGQMLTPD